MVQALSRPTVRGPTFVRLLARLTNADVPDSRQSLPDRLSQWLDWKHALALSTALDGRPASDGLGLAPGSSEQEEECIRLRASLAQGIADDPLLAVSGADEPAAEPDFAPFRQRCLHWQRRMQSGTGHLRGHLRDMLGQVSVPMAHLAEVDSVMELALSPREQMLLAAVPVLLGEHFERLRGNAQADATDTAAGGAWLDVFRKDMQSVLLAELDVRFQPVEALLAALRNPPTEK